MAGGRATVLGALLCGSIALSAASAQNVPLPTPAPLPKTGTPAGEPGRPPAPLPLQPGGSQGGPQTGLRFPFQLFNPFKLGETTAFDAKQRALVDRVSAYLSSVRTLTGDFVQVGSDGRRTEGQFYLQKPGRVRFEYEPPSPIELIADGQSVVVRDRRLATRDLYPLSQTPLRFLLADQVDLLRETNVVGVFSDETFVTVVIEERQIIAGTHRLMLMFGAKDLQLKQWTVTDPQGYDTTIAIYNLDSKKTLDPNMFRIDYERSFQ
jgi:outer membrane lipoprotein-sorting protein